MQAKIYHLFVTGILFLALQGFGQFFNSGSTGANGSFPPGTVPEDTTDISLNLKTGIVTYQPSGTEETLPSTPGDGFTDGILHFTTFQVPVNTTLTFEPNTANTPVFILAQSDITIDGTIDIRGKDGKDINIGGGGLGGPGGFRGGNGEVIKSNPGGGGSGLGPGGGKGGGGPGDGDLLGGGGGGGYAIAGTTGPNVQGGSNGGTTYGSIFLLPFIGGSGGGGGNGHAIANPTGGGGGGGGGALLVASSTSIRISGSINATGGKGGFAPNSSLASSGGGGSGGAIRLMSNNVSGNGSLICSGGSGSKQATNRSGGNGGSGRIRIEAFNDTFTGVGTTKGVTTATAGAGVIFLPNPAKITITQIDGQAVPNPPIGGFGGADIIINAPGTYTVNIITENIPEGTNIAVTAKPESDELVIGPVTGAIASDATSVDLTFDKPGLYFLEASATLSQ